MPLTDIACKSAAPREKSYRMADSGGLYLEIMPNGSKYWRMKYRFLVGGERKEKRLALGVYPTVSLAMARQGRDEAKRLLAAGVDPMADKKAKEQQTIEKSKNSFEAVAREWLHKQSMRWEPKTTVKITAYLEKDIFPFLGCRPIADIDPPELLGVLRKVEARGAYYKAGRVRQICGQIFRYGVATGKNPRDPSADLKGALTTAKTKHYAALEIKDMPEFLQKLEKNDARLFPQTRRGIKLLMLTFVRTSELINAEWSEFDLENAIWEIPAERMKMGKPHIVPLSRQVMALLQEQKEETAHLNTPYVFPNQVRPKKPMSNNTILAGIKRLGYTGRMTGHGFRALAMTTLMEQLGYPHEIPDTQLAHAKGDNTRRAYDRTKYLPQRVSMMQQWADYLDKIASDGKIIISNFRARA